MRLRRSMGRWAASIAIAGPLTSGCGAGGSGVQVDGGALSDGSARDGGGAAGAADARAPSPDSAPPGDAAATDEEREDAAGAPPDGGSSDGAAGPGPDVARPGIPDARSGGSDGASGAAGCAQGAAPPAALTDWIGGHGTAMTRFEYDGHVALYIDDETTRREAPWVLPFATAAVQYMKSTYDPAARYGPNCLYVFLHRGRFGGGTISSYFDSFSGFRNAADVGAGSWARGTNVDLLSHELAHIVEGSSNATHESPAFPVWGDSKWAEFFQYDLYVALGMTADAERVHAKFIAGSDNYPRAGTRWFRDWFFPLWRDHGKATVMARFFKLLSEHFPKRQENDGRNPIYSRRMNLGELVHFTSGAAGTDLRALAEKAFGDGFAAELTKARADFPNVRY